MPATDLPTVLADFEAGRITPARFSHREHVRVGYELLERHPFPEALLHLARGLRRLAAAAGRPDVYHETITAAFLALIAERRLGERYLSWEDFAERNPDLFRKELLEEIYEPAVLKSPLARQTFVLPRNGREAAGRAIAIAGGSTRILPVGSLGVSPGESNRQP